MNAVADNRLSQFQIWFEKYMNNPSFPPTHSTPSEFYNLGIDLILHDPIVSASTKEKEKILQKLMLVFPMKSDLLYYMGCLYQNEDFYTALFWFQKCYFTDPHNVENVLDLLKLLFMRSHIDYIFYLNIDFSLYKEDTRVLVSLGSIYIKQKEQNQFEKALPIYEKLLDHFQWRQDKSVDHDKDENYLNLKCMTLTNSLYLFSEMTDVVRTQYMIEYIPQYISQYLSKMTRETIEHFLNNLIIWDNIYHDPSQRLAISKWINTIHPNEDRKFPLRISSPTPRQKCNIGYVAYSFVYDAVSNFIGPILENHDFEKFNVFLFAQDKYPTVKEIFGTLPIEIMNIEPLSTAECVSLIQSKNIHILVDLAGLTVNNRMDVFAKNPAPIQMTYLGYPNTCGLKAVKYRLVDSITDPMEAPRYYSETLIRMPKCFLLFQSILQLTPVVKLPPPNNDWITAPIIFGSLNKENKNSEDVLRVWRIIMKKTEHLHTYILIKLNKTKDAESRVKFYAEKLDVSPSRILPAADLSNDEYIDLFRKTDIVLDTFPYSGTTTSCNSLYNSLPIITLRDSRFHAHSVTSSLLIHCGLSELVATTENQYIDKAVELASNRLKLHSYHVGEKCIHKKFQSLMNPGEFMKSYENILENLYHSDVLNTHEQHGSTYDGIAD